MKWPSPEQVAKTLGGARRSGDKWAARCPAHDDRNPSLSIETGSDGSLLVHCHAGCTQNDVIAALRERGLWPTEIDRKSLSRAKPAEQWSLVSPVPSDATPPNFASLCGRTPDAIYAYRDRTGNLLGYQCRVAKSGGKRFVPITYWRDKAGHFQWRSEWLPPPRPLYGLHALAIKPDASVLIVEGEKAADSARDMFPEYAIVTWPNGANAVASANWEPLKGRRITIWPDNDEPGRNAANEIADALKACGAREVRFVTLPDGLPAKWDLADELPAGVDAHRLLEHAAAIDDSYAPFVITARELLHLDVKSREYIIAPFLAVGALAMLFAARGVGKTWLALVLALAIARGQEFLAYSVVKPRIVLYVDGEMPLALLKERLTSLGGEIPEYLLFLTSEKLALGGQSLNINEPTHRQRLNDTLDRLEAIGRKPELIILDNLSSLGAGIDENDNSALDGQLAWLTQLRFRGHSVLLIHHAGKSGDQRGASRREDLLDTTIKLAAPGDADRTDCAGATFEMTFTKTRGIMPDPDKLVLSLRENPRRQLEFHYQKPIKIAPHLQTLLVIAKGAPDRSGDPRPFQSQDELAVSAGLSKAAISKHVRKLKQQELVVSQGTSILLTREGASLAEKFLGTQVTSQLIESMLGGPVDDDPDDIPI